MYKVLIVDDEMLVRIGMKSLIRWEEHGFEIIGDACDGEEALRIVEEQIPDIILTDIVMPGMGGLQLIEQVKGRYPFIRIIVLSSHQDFDYVREAMKLGSDDYILKTSLRPQEFLEVLQRTMVKLQKEHSTIVRRDHDEQGEKGEIIFQVLAADQLELGDVQRLMTEMNWGAYSAFKRFLYIKIHHAHDISGYKMVEKTLLHVLEQQLQYMQGTELYPYKEGELFLLCSFPEKSAAETLVELAPDMIHSVKRYVNISVSMGIGSVFSALDEMRSAFIQAREACEYSFYLGVEQCYLSRDRFFSSESLVLTLQDKTHLEEAIQYCREDTVFEQLERIYQKLVSTRMKVSHVKALYLDLLHIMKKESEQMGLDWAGFDEDKPFYVHIMYEESLAQLHAWTIAYVTRLIQCLNEVHKSNYRDEIRQLVAYLKQNFSSNITLSDASRIANMSESYLSYIFKKETGKSFIEYLTDLRIGKASEYLKSTDWPSYIIAEKVGYENINYFGRAFKKVTGKSPSQFRDLCKN